jgi:predicted secreted protein
MSISMAVFTFINTWWIMLFFVFPFHVRPVEEHTQLEYAAAPKSIRWKRMLVIDTVLSLIVTAALALLISSGIFPVDTMT